MQETLQNLNAGVSVVVFPEGTRSVSGRLQPFKKGFFRLVADNPDIRILPIGASCLLPRVWVYGHRKSFFGRDFPFVLPSVRSNAQQCKSVAR